MITFIIIAFLVGYLGIALEHTLKTNKAATALLLASVLWVAYIFYAPQIGRSIEQVLNVDIIENLGDASQTLFFLLGAMTVVELIDIHGGFSIITDRITTKNKRKLLWVISLLTFFLSAILDNLTTTIVMVMLLRKLIADKSDRWLFASMVVLAANAGGAWSPIGDVTTIMLWIRGNVTTGHLIPKLILPSLAAMIVPLAVVSYSLHGNISTPEKTAERAMHPAATIISNKQRKKIFFFGICALIFVPIFKSITHLPPFIGILFGLSLLWIYTDFIYHRMKQVDEAKKARISSVLNRVDTPTILFFLGILMAVAVLKLSGILDAFSTYLDNTIGDYRLITLIIGFISSIVDNVPLVAGAIGMYDVVPIPAEGLSMLNPELLPYIQDGSFWLFLTYCAGVGGSILIIGSAAGVVAMGIEGIDFIWYLKRISWLAAIGYLSGAAVFLLEQMIFAI